MQEKQKQKTSKVAREEQLNKTVRKKDLRVLI
jgi:hypothetical protein